MEKATDLEIKYQKLATEYSKVKSQAMVLKKAVLDEQAKNNELKEIVKEHEQKLRKHDQEMESLTFRNEQLMKRISVLQQELQNNSHSKKSKSKHLENASQSNFTIFDEELQKKILENAQLMSAMADKEIELEDNKGKISWLEKQLTELQSQIETIRQKHKKDIEKLKKDQSSSWNLNDQKGHTLETIKRVADVGQGDAKTIQYWQSEAERWKNEYEVLRSRPESNEQMTEYYELQIRELLEVKQLAQSEAKSLWAENSALAARLEHIVLEKSEAEASLEKHIEELNTTSDNYKSQLDAMTEHLAAQNEKITKLSDEVQVLKHKLALKK